MALGRHATAALLNAVSPKVNYLYTEIEVIQMVQDAYTSGDFEATKDLFETQNELGLGGSFAGLWIEDVPNKYSLLSAATGGTPDLVVIGKPHFAGRQYLIVGSLSGEFPGTPLPNGALLPLNWDAFTMMTVAYANTTLLPHFMGTLDSLGTAKAQIVTGPLPPVFVGLTMNFAYLLGKPIQVICGWSVFLEIAP